MFCRMTSRAHHYAIVYVASATRHYTPRQEHAAMPLRHCCRHAANMPLRRHESYAISVMAEIIITLVLPPKYNIMPPRYKIRHHC